MWRHFPTATRPVVRVDAAATDAVRPLIERFLRTSHGRRGRVCFRRRSFSKEGLRFEPLPLVFILIQLLPQQPFNSLTRLVHSRSPAAAVSSLRSAGCVSWRLARVHEHRASLGVAAGPGSPHSNARVCASYIFFCQIFSPRSECPPPASSVSHRLQREPQADEPQQRLQHKQPRRTRTHTPRPLLSCLYSLHRCMPVLSPGLHVTSLPSSPLVLPSRDLLRVSAPPRSAHWTSDFAADSTARIICESKPRQHRRTWQP